MKNLKELRESLRISQHKLAKDIGISQSNICEYEKGTVEATETIIIKLANYFDVTTDYLLGVGEYDGSKPTKHNTTINESPNFNVSTHTNNGILNIQYKSNK